MTRITDTRFEGYTLDIAEQVKRRVPNLEKREAILAQILRSTSPDQTMVLAPTLLVDGEEIPFAVAVFSPAKRLSFGIMEKDRLDKMIEAMDFVPVRRQ